ncbi:MAG TPA: hypothetical protein EYP98_15750 [Planctomycetes bacterium]|nr:hypothetical protein [Planctomycetota bacterium]
MFSNSTISPADGTEPVVITASRCMCMFCEVPTKQVSSNCTRICGGEIQNTSSVATIAKTMPGHHSRNRTATLDSRTRQRQTKHTPAKPNVSGISQ